MTIELWGLQFTVLEFAALALFALAFLVQMFYLSLLINFIFSGKKKDAAPVTPGVSIIVTSRNYHDWLKELLPVLLSQDYPDYEVVVVDDCSTDGTDWLLANQKISHGNLKTTRIIQETDFPNALAITIGVRASSKEWLIFLHPQCKVHGNQWLRSFAQSLEPGKEVSIGYVNYGEASGGYKNWIRYENFYSYLVSGAGRALGHGMPVFEHNIAYKREKFLDLKGFAAVLDSPFSENELYINKISTRKNMVVQLGKASSVGFAGEADWFSLGEFKKKQLKLRRKLRPGQRFFRFLNMTSRLALTTAFACLMFVSPWRYWILGVWSFVLIFEMTWILVATRKSGERNVLPMLLIYKALLPVINVTFVINQLLFGRKRKWK